MKSSSFYFILCFLVCSIEIAFGQNKVAPTCKIPLPHQSKIKQINVKPENPQFYISVEALAVKGALIEKLCYPDNKADINTASALRMLQAELAAGNAKQVFVNSVIVNCNSPVTLKYNKFAGQLDSYSSAEGISLPVVSIKKYDFSTLLNVGINNLGTFIDLKIEGITPEGPVVSHKIKTGPIQFQSVKSWAWSGIKNVKPGKIAFMSGPAFGNAELLFIINLQNLKKEIFKKASSKSVYFNDNIKPKLYFIKAPVEVLALLKSQQQDKYPFLDSSKLKLLISKSQVLISREINANTSGNVHEWKTSITRKYLRGYCALKDKPSPVTDSINIFSTECYYMNKQKGYIVVNINAEKNLPLTQFNTIDTPLGPVELPLYNFITLISNPMLPCNSIAVIAEHEENILDSNDMESVNQITTVNIQKRNKETTLTGRNKQSHSRFVWILKAGSGSNGPFVNK